MPRQTEKTYSLTAPVSAAYERDKKYMPSGYAKVSLTLVPDPSSSLLRATIEANMDGIWRLLEYQSPVNGQLHIVSPEIEKSLWKEAIVGINEGAEVALQGYLDLPVRQVKVVVNEIVFHPVYSTTMAFKIVGQKAVESALEKARQQELLVPVLDV